MKDEQEMHIPYIKIDPYARRQPDTPKIPKGWHDLKCICGHVQKYELHVREKGRCKSSENEALLMNGDTAIRRMQFVCWDCASQYAPTDPSRDKYDLNDPAFCKHLNAICASFGPTFLDRALKDITITKEEFLEQDAPIFSAMGKKYTEAQKLSNWHMLLSHRKTYQDEWEVFFDICQNHPSFREYEMTGVNRFLCQWTTRNCECAA